MQPIPVTLERNLLPFATLANLIPSEMISTFPVIPTTHEYLLEINFAILTASFFSSTIAVSTPLVEALNPARNEISDKLPRITSIFTCERISCTVLFRSADAPAPTGSKTTGILSSLAFLPAIIIEAIVR